MIFHQNTHCCPYRPAIFTHKSIHITMSYENSKIHVESLEKNIRHKDNIFDQVLLDLQKISTQSTGHPQAELPVDHQELASMQYDIYHPTRS